MNNYKKGKRLMMEDYKELDGQKVVIRKSIDQKNEMVMTLKLGEIEMQDRLIDDCGNEIKFRIKLGESGSYISTKFEIFEYIEVDNKEYQYSEILKMIEKKEITNPYDTIIASNNLITSLEGIINKEYHLDYLLNLTFTIQRREHEYLFTFDDAKKFCTPYHIRTGYDYSKYKANEFVYEMARKVWRQSAY